jgi:histidinol-phosphate aminotransferase
MNGSATEVLIKLSANESADQPLPSVLAAIAEAASGINRYPDYHSIALTGALSRHLGVPETHLAVGCGSAGVLQMLLESVGVPGAEIVYAWRSFEAYPLLVALSGATPVEVPLADDVHDLNAMAAAVNDNTRAVVICNPNNPTGTTVRRTELTAFLDRVPPSCLVILDEAYREYVRDDQVPDGLEVSAGRPNVVVVRTFSKAYGLAGLRVGYLVGHPGVVEAACSARLPFSVNSVAQAAAIASLAAESELRERVVATINERERVREALLGQGWTVPPSAGNFLWLRPGDATTTFAELCESAGVSVRAFGSDGVRVSIGSAEENDALLAIAAESQLSGVR